MKRNHLHNLLVAAYAAGVQRCMEPFSVTMRMDPDSVAAHLAGAARKYAESVVSSPNVTIVLED